MKVIRESVTGRMERLGHARDVKEGLKKEREGKNYYLITLSYSWYRLGEWGELRTCGGYWAKTKEEAKELALNDPNYAGYKNLKIIED